MFKFCGRYFYSPMIYLDLDSDPPALVSGRTELYAGPWYGGRQLLMANPEELIEIEYGRNYQHTVVVAMPQILAEWHATHRVPHKSARTAM